MPKSKGNDTLKKYRFEDEGFFASTVTRKIPWGKIVSPSGKLLIALMFAIQRIPIVLHSHFLPPNGVHSFRVLNWASSICSTSSINGMPCIPFFSNNSKLNETIYNPRI